MGLPGWFRHADFEYHAHVRIAVSNSLLVLVSSPALVMGGIPLGMSFEYDVHYCFVSALVPLVYLLRWGVQPQLYADNLKCVSR